MEQHDHAGTPSSDEGQVEAGGVPDPWADDPLSRPSVPPRDARDPISQAHRRDALEEARRVARIRGRRALIGTIIIPLSILQALPKSTSVCCSKAVELANQLARSVVWYFPHKEWYFEE